jgi:hypothetical protein
MVAKTAIYFAIGLLWTFWVFYSKRNEKIVDDSFRSMGAHGNSISFATAIITSTILWPISTAIYVVAFFVVRFQRYH